MKIQGRIKLMVGNGKMRVQCSMTYYSVDQRREIVRSWKEIYGDIVIQICPTF